MKSNPADGPSRSRFAASLWLIALFIVAALGFFFFTTSSASAAIFINLTPTPTQENLWAYVQLPKPTYTATITIPPTETPTSTPEPTSTPGQMVMEILNDTPVPTYAPPQAGSVASYGGSKYILVDISEQHMYVYEGDALVYSFVSSTGMNNATRVGTFAVQSKIPNAYGATWDIWMPSWLGIYWSGGLESRMVVSSWEVMKRGSCTIGQKLARPLKFSGRYFPR
jgi:L,D-transpeptidase catalytic domain